MKNILYLIVFIIIFMININMVSAASCDNEDMARLKGLAAGVSYSAEYIGDQVGASSIQDYNVNFIGLTDEIYVSDNHYTFKVLDDNQKIVVLSGVSKFEIYSKNCNDLRLKTITVDLPKFNVYSLKSECTLDKYKNLDICDPWYGVSLTEEVFYDTINDFDEKVKDNNSFIDDIIELYWDNQYIFWGVIIFISLVLIIICVFNYRKNILD